MNKNRGSPRKFSEKIALLNKKEAEGNAEFERIIKEVEETTRVSPQPTSTRLNAGGGGGAGIIYQQANFGNEDWSSSKFATHRDNSNNWLTNGYTTTDVNSATSPTGSFHAIGGGGGLIIDNSATGSFDLDQSNPSSLDCYENQQHHNQQPISGYYSTTTNNNTVDNNLNPPIVLVDHNQHHIEVETPANVPNINIFPIEDDEDQQQQQHSLVDEYSHQEHQHNSNRNIINTNGQHFNDNQHQQQVPILNDNNTTITTNSYRSLDCSNFNQISSARSLPDIANLRVSSSTICSSGLAPSYSDQRINFLTDNDNNNINSNNYDSDYSHHQNQQQQHHHQFNTNNARNNFIQNRITTETTNQNMRQQQTSWDQTDNNSQNNQLHHQQQQFSFVQEQNNNNNLDARFIQRSNSTNPILCGSWNDNNNLSTNFNQNNQHRPHIKATDLNPNLSKSTEICYSYPPPNTEIQLVDNQQHHHHHQQQLPLPAYRERSSSYNNIENIRNDLKMARYAQQQQQQQQINYQQFGTNQNLGQHQQLQSEPVYTDNSVMDYQFYEQ